VNIYNAVKPQKIKIKSKMKHIPVKQVIIGASILLLALIGYYYFSTSSPRYVKKYKATIDSAQRNIDSLEIEVAASEKIIDSLSFDLSMEDRENSRLKEQIIDIKKKNHEKLTAVDKLNDAELKRFFTDRYDVQ
jgi:septal ring factor EnvC (AmiA/AmiB activator)